MAYRVSQYNSGSTNSVNYDTIVGVQVPFQGTLISSSLPGSDAVFNSNYTTREQIKSNILNFLLTDQGERYFNVQFGSNLRRYLFSNITSDGFDFGTVNLPDGRTGQFINIGIPDLQANIKNDLSSVFPMITVNSVNIIPNQDTNQVSISINYSFSKFEKDEVLNITM